MEIILRKEIEALGERGEVVKVKSGYARNYLIPYGLAVFATKEAKEEIERERVREERRKEERRRDLAEQAKQLENTSCTISAQANEEGHLFGSVAAAEIIEAFAEDGIQLGQEQIVLEQPIKEIGVYAFQIRIHEGIVVDSKVWVVKE